MSSAPPISLVIPFLNDAFYLAVLCIFVIDRDLFLHAAWCANVDSSILYPDNDLFVSHMYRQDV